MQTVNDHPSLRTLRRVAHALAEADSLERRTERSLEALAEVVSFDAALVCLRRTATGRPMAVPWGMPPALADRVQHAPAADDLIVRVSSWIDVVSVSRRIHDADLRGGTFEREMGLTHAKAFPLSAGPDVLGSLVLGWRQRRALSDDETALVECTADLMGLALRQETLIDRNVELEVLRERARLARDIHDGVTQLVTAAVMNMGAAEREIATAPESARQAIETAQRLAREALGDLRRSIWNLRAGLRQGQSLEAALWEAAEPLVQAGISCSVEVHGAERQLPAEVEAAALSVAREALSNVLRHAQAKVVDVNLTIGPVCATLAVTDDGVGISGNPQAQSFGLLGMDERARSVGGVLRLQSYPGQGTRVEAELPYDRTSA
ncbi:MAG: hypothetical protein Kow0010_20660 [Dehalococcoidia bacterium]